MARANGSISGAGWPAGRSRSGGGTATFISDPWTRPGLWRIEPLGSRLVLAAIYKAGLAFLGDQMAPDNRPWPTEVRLAKDKKALTVTFDTGESFALDAEYLRVMSPSAEVQGHSPDERKTQPGKRNVAILEGHPIGNYAVRLGFDDMHCTGIYSWDYFAELGRNRARKWKDYVDELASKGLSRDPPKRA